MKRAIALCIFGATILQPVLSKADAKQTFVAAADAYFDEAVFPYAPTQGTLTGYHHYDAKLEDFSRKNIDAHIAALHSFDKRISAIPASSLDQSTRADRELVLASIHSAPMTAALAIR